MNDREKRSAINLAIKLMEKRIGAIAFHASLEDVYAAGLAVTKSASEERKRLKRAIEVLAEIEKEVCGVRGLTAATIIRDEAKEISSETLNILDEIGEANY